ADHAAGLGGHVGAVDGDERAHAFATVGPALGLDHVRTHRRRGLWHVVEEGVGLLREERLDREHAAEHDGDADDHQDPAKRRPGRALVAWGSHEGILVETAPDGRGWHCGMRHAARRAQMIYRTV